MIKESAKNLTTYARNILKISVFPAIKVIYLFKINVLSIQKKFKTQKIRTVLFGIGRTVLA